jgi:hypothetical protein
MARSGPQGIAGIAHSVGKPGRKQQPGFSAQRITGGDPTMHSLGQYGKNPPALLGAAPMPGSSPIAHAGMRMMQGSGGQQSRHIRYGGFGPGKMGAMGTSGNYSMSNNQDTE